MCLFIYSIALHWIVSITYILHIKSDIGYNQLYTSIDDLLFFYSVYYNIELLSHVYIGCTICTVSLHWFLQYQLSMKYVIHIKKVIIITLHSIWVLLKQQVTRIKLLCYYIYWWLLQLHNFAYVYLHCTVYIN